MTTIKPPVVFKAEDFHKITLFPDNTTKKQLASLANEILSQRLKPWYASKYATLPGFDISEEPTDYTKHVIFGLDPIEIPKPPVKKEIKELEWLCDQHRITGLAKDAVINYYKDKL